MDLWFYRLELFKEPNDDTIKFKKNIINEINKATKTSLNLIDTIKKLFPSLTNDEIKKISDAKKEDLNKLPICVQLYIIDGTVKTVWDILSEGINIYDYYIRKIDFENMKDRPRPLDDETIEKIVQRVFYYENELDGFNKVSVPRIKGAVLKAREYVTNRGIEWFKKELKSVLVSRSNIEQLTTLCEHDLTSSIAVPGTAVGILVGESLGSMNTQVILNTFHASGQDTSASMNTNSYSDILGASENPNAINTVVAFNNKYITYEEAYRKRADIMGIFFRDVLLDNIEIERLDKIGGFQWWHKTGTRDLNPEEIVLRLHFDINRLYSHEIELETLRDKIQDTIAIAPKNMSSKDDKFLKDGLSDVFCSPTHVGIIDIYPNRDIIISVMNNSPLKCEQDNDNCIRLFLKIFVLDELKRTKIKGIQGIVGIFPQIEPVMQIILEEKNKNDPAIQSIMLDEDIENPDHLWVLYLNKIRIRMTGIKAENVSYLLSLCGIRTLLIVEEKAYMIVLSEEKPTKAVLRNVKKDKDRIRYLIKEKVREGYKGYIKFNRTELINASEYIYLLISAEKGTETLSQLMCKRYVDPQHTYSSNSHELTKLIGIEAAYNYIYNTLNVVSDAVGGANRRHIDVVTQVITRNGKPKGLKTQSRESASGFLSRATFSKASAIIIAEAVSGAKEGMFSPSTAIMTGQIPKIGTGYNKIDNEELNEEFLDNEEYEDYKDKEIKEEYEKIEIGELDEDFDYAGDKVITNLNPAVQSYEEFKKEQLVPIESLYKLNIKVGKANKVVIDDIPALTLKPSQNLQGYLPGIVRLLDKYSTFKFGSNNIDDLHIDLPEKQIRKILMDVVALTDVNTNTENSIDRGIDEFTELLSIADEFA